LKAIFFVVILFLLACPSAFGQISDKTGLKQTFIIETGGYEFPVDVTSSFNVERIDFSSDEKRLTLHINNALEQNLAEIQIPKNLTNGNFTFFLDDQEIFPEVQTNKKISFITLEFNGTGIHKLDVIGTTYLPEFSDIAPLILSVLLIPIIFVRKIKKLFI
jgi:ribosomal protein L5